MAIDVGPGLALQFSIALKWREDKDQTIADSPDLPKPAQDDRRRLRRRLLVIFLAMFLAQAIGSLFNISYNLVHITPLLSERQALIFQQAINGYNLSAYPVCIALWACIVHSLARPCRDSSDRIKQQRRVINLPWWATGIAAGGWLGAIPALCLALRSSEEPINGHIWFHLPVSILTATVIALSLGYLAIDWLRMRYLFPFFFEQVSPAQTQGGYDLSVTGRGVLLIASASVAPIIALLMLLISPSPASKNLWFALAVAGAGIGFALFGTLLLRWLVADPIRELRQAAQAIGEGRREIKVSNLRADEFGILADEFNAMAAGLQQKEQIEATFGRHVGKEAAAELLKKEADLKGIERTVAVLFSDIRGFTTRSENTTPQEAVQLLNEFHTTMTAEIEKEGGMVNAIMGDGLMSLFGAIGTGADFAEQAVRAGQAMLRALPALNQRLEGQGFEPIRIGVGIHTGPAVIGSIGSPRRLKYTAIGDTVNTAARIESMTKELRAPLLISESTWNRLPGMTEGTKLPPQAVRGRSQDIILYSISY